jgi:hypothetical protein
MMVKGAEGVMLLFILKDVRLLVPLNNNRLSAIMTTICECSLTGMVISPSPLAAMLLL